MAFLLGVSFFLGGLLCADYLSLAKPMRLQTCSHGHETCFSILSSLGWAKLQRSFDLDLQPGAPKTIKQRFSPPKNLFLGTKNRAFDGFGCPRKMDVFIRNLHPSLPSLDLSPFQAELLESRWFFRVCRSSTCRRGTKRGQKLAKCVQSMFETHVCMFT